MDTRNPTACDFMEQPDAFIPHDGYGPDYLEYQLREIIHAYRQRRIARADFEEIFTEEWPNGDN